MVVFFRSSLAKGELARMMQTVQPLREDRTAAEVYSTVSGVAYETYALALVRRARRAHWSEFGLSR